ncbi:hypothetical protein NFI96_029525 [Prochilodus magdalenae]|nr:hypothetical protein NFI96_029525 [Prochilodus magdalenae]
MFTEQWEIRLVLLGNVGAGKSASGNTLLGVTGFTSRISPNLVTKHCEAQTVTLGERQIKVVDTPGLTATMVTDTTKDKLLHCLQLSAPGPHIFLLVVPVGRFTQEERASMERVVAVFGRRVYKFSIILFTFKDRLKNSSIERFIMSAGDDLQQLVQTCGSRYHAFNNENPGNEDQVGPLLAQIDKLVAANGGCWYTQVTDTEEFEGRPDKQLLDDKKDYEATSKVHETKPGVNKGETKNTENMEFEENLKKREEWVWRQEEQLWKRDEQLRALENHLRTSEEQIMKWKEDLHRQLEAERRDRIQEKQEMDRVMKEVENRSHDLKLEKENMDSEMKELERQQIHIEAQKEEMRQRNMTKLVIEKEVEELKKKSIQAQTLERERNAEIKKLQEEKTKLQEEVLEFDQQKKRTSDEIERQKSMKEINEREIERQTTQLQEQSTEIQTQKGEIDRQEREIQTNARTIKQTRRKKLILENRVQTEEKELQIKKTELERLKDLHEENVRLKRFEDEQNKYREMRRREEDLQTLQDLHHQLDTRLSSSNYTPDCNTERDLSVELGKIIEKMKMEVQRCSEEMEVLINTQEERERIQRQESSEKDDGAEWCSTGTGGQTRQKYKVIRAIFFSYMKPRYIHIHMVYETHLPQIFVNTDHSYSQGIIRKSALKGLMEILQHLNLENFYPNKLTIESVLSIGSPKETHSNSNMAFIYLQKLLMQNYRVRFITLRNKENKNKEFTQSARTGGHLNRKYGTGVGGAFDAVNDDGSNYGAECQTIAKDISRLVGDMEEHDHLDKFLSARDDSINAKEMETIHPMDIQMAVFHCADSFLRQNIVTKLSSCQYALPLLVPSPISKDIELPLWTFRQIKKTWKSVGGSSTSLPVCQVKAPMVFFCRLGSVSTSKSQLLNSLINPKHDTFFHRDSPGSSRTRLFMEGLVEITWYCPAGNTDDLFSECTAFCNLHGDAAEHREQTDFLTERAAVNVVLIQHVKPNEKERELLEKLHKSSKPLIWVVCDLQRGPLKISHGLNIKIGLGGRNHNELSNELTSAIKTCLQRCNFSPSFSLEESSDHAKCFGFKVDEDNKDCQKGKTGALKIMKHLEGENISEVKNKFLPCQGKLWHDWSKNNKKLHRLHEETEHTRNATLTEMNKIRMKQRGNNLRFMKSLVKNLLLNSITQKRYFIQWIRHFIDTKFSDQVSQLHLEYNSKWLEVQ